jgi:hypothetical protein
MTAADGAAQSCSDVTCGVSVMHRSVTGGARLRL